MRSLPRQLASTSAVDQEERVPPGGTEHFPFVLLREVHVPQERFHELRRLCVVQPRQAYVLVKPFAGHELHRVLERVLRPAQPHRELFRSIRADQQDRGVADGPGDVVHEGDRRRVRPLEVVEREEDRHLARLPDEAEGHVLEETVPPQQRVATGVIHAVVFLRREHGLEERIHPIELFKGAGPGRQDGAVLVLDAGDGVLQVLDQELVLSAPQHRHDGRVRACLQEDPILAEPQDVEPSLRGTTGRAHGVLQELLDDAEHRREDVRIERRLRTLRLREHEARLVDREQGFDAEGLFEEEVVESALLERLEERGVRRERFREACAAHRTETLRGGVVRELLEEAGLADPRLAGEEDDAPPSRQGRVERGAELPDLGGATDQARAERKLPRGRCHGTFRISTRSA